MADLTYTQLRKSVSDMRKDVARSSDAIRVRAQEIDEEAQDTTRVAEQIGGMGVDPGTTSETRELARIMKGLSDAAIAYAAAGDTTAKAATAANDQARATHSGIQEAYNRAPVDMSHLKREWLIQE